MDRKLFIQFVGRAGGGVLSAGPRKRTWNTRRLFSESINTGKSELCLRVGLRSLGLGVGSLGFELEGLGFRIWELGFMV